MLNALLTATTTRTFIEMASIHIIISANYVMCKVFTTINNVLMRSDNVTDMVETDIHPPWTNCSALVGVSL